MDFSSFKLTECGTSAQTGVAEGRRRENGAHVASYISPRLWDNGSRGYHEFRRIVRAFLFRNAGQPRAFRVDFEHFGDDAVKNGALVLIMLVQRAFRHVQIGGDVADGHRLAPVSGEQAQSRHQDFFLCVHRIFLKSEQPFTV